MNSFPSCVLVSTHLLKHHFGTYSTVTYSVSYKQKTELQ